MVRRMEKVSREREWLEDNVMLERIGGWKGGLEKRMKR